MKGRTIKRADGGRIMEAGGNPKVLAEFKERKRGGRVKDDKHAGKVSGELSKFRLDRPGRKRGGRVGADMNPLSSAHKTSSSDD